MAEEDVNVLVFGHTGSGKSSLISKVLELGGLVSDELIQSYKDKSKDAGQNKEKPDWYLHYTAAAKNKSTFGRIFYKKGTRNFRFLELQREESYVPKLMMKTKKATIGVLVLSGVYREKFSCLDATQTIEYIELFRAICESTESVLHESSKLIVLINKRDAQNFFNHGVQFAAYLTFIGFESSKVDIIPFSSHNEGDIRYFLDRLDTLAVSKNNNCLSDAKEAETRDKPEALEPEVLEIVEISANSYCTYLINPQIRDTIYPGSLVISGRSSENAFIPIALSKLGDYAEIRSLCSRHRSMLELIDITESTIVVDTPLLVAEDVETIDYLFTGMFNKFVEEDNSSIVQIRLWSEEDRSKFMNSWWERIAKDFQIIFGDVVNGLLYLYSLEMPSGGLYGNIYVSRRDNHARILPRMDKRKTFKDDMDDLVHIMIRVIYQPGLQLGSYNRDYLPLELEHFLSFVEKEKLNYVSPAWLIDQPYFWSSPHRVNFMRKFRKCMQNLTINFQDVNDAVGDMMVEKFGKNNWFDCLEDPLLLKILEPSKQGEIKQYSQNGDVVRFFIAVFSHANEQHRDRLNPIDEGVHEEILRDYFPRIYTCLVNLIFGCVLGWAQIQSAGAQIQSAEVEHVNVERLLKWFLSSSDV